MKDLTWQAVRAPKLEKSWLFDVSMPPLHLDGWFRSRRENKCVDLAGNPVRWITYPAIELEFIGMAPIINY